MDTSGFEEFLGQQSSITSEKAIRSRISKASKVENDLHINLDDIVKNKEDTYNILLRIQNEMKEANGVYQNAVRKYYEYKNGIEFPRMKEFE